MYLIKLRFESNIKGIYTYEEETADNSSMKDMKIIRMLEKWCEILKININFRPDFLYSYNDKISIYKAQIQYY